MAIIISVLVVGIFAYLWGFSDGVNTGKGNSIVHTDREG